MCCNHTLTLCHNWTPSRRRAIAKHRTTWKMVQVPQQNHSGGIDVCNVSREDPKKAFFLQVLTTLTVPSWHHQIQLRTRCSWEHCRPPGIRHIWIMLGRFMLSTLLQGAMVSDCHCPLPLGWIYTVREYVRKGRYLSAPKPGVELRWQAHNRSSSTYFKLLTLAIRYNRRGRFQYTRPSSLVRWIFHCKRVRKVVIGKVCSKCLQIF